MGSLLAAVQRLGGSMALIGATTVAAFVLADATAEKVGLWDNGWFLTAVAATLAGIAIFGAASFLLARHKSKVRGELEGILDEGQNLYAQSRDGTQPLPEAEAQAWIDRTRLWLVRRLNGAYRARFDSNPGMTPRPLNVEPDEDTEARRSVAASLEFRLQRLHAFLEELER